MTRHGRRQVRGDAGTTLVELLIATAILGIGVTAVVGGMMTSITASDVSRKDAEAQSLTRTYAEAVSADAYVGCAGSYAAAGFAAPAGYSATMAVSYWNPATSTFSTPCGTDSGLQRVALTVSSTDGRATDTLLIAKRLKPAGDLS